MTHWNRYDDAVWAERHRLRDYGYPDPQARHLPYADSYKAQALRELAHRLLLEARLAEVQAELARAIDRFEDAKCELDIARMPPPAEGGKV